MSEEVKLPLPSGIRARMESWCAALAIASQAKTSAAATAGSVSANMKSLLDADLSTYTPIGEEKDDGMEERQKTSGREYGHREKLHPVRDGADPNGSDRSRGCDPQYRQRAAARRSAAEAYTRGKRSRRRPKRRS